MWKLEGFSFFSFVHIFFGRAFSSIATFTDDDDTVAVAVDAATAAAVIVVDFSFDRLVFGSTTCLNYPHVRFDFLSILGSYFSDSTVVLHRCCLTTIFIYIYTLPSHPIPYTFHHHSYYTIIYSIHTHAYTYLKLSVPPIGRNGAHIAKMYCIA